MWYCLIISLKQSILPKRGSLPYGIASLARLRCIKMLPPWAAHKVLEQSISFFFFSTLGLLGSSSAFFHDFVYQMNKTTGKSSWIFFTPAYLNPTNSSKAFACHILCSPLYHHPKQCSQCQPLKLFHMQHTQPQWLSGDPLLIRHRHAYYAIRCLFIEHRLHDELTTPAQLWIMDDDDAAGIIKCLSREKIIIQ